MGVELILAASSKIGSVGLGMCIAVAVFQIKPLQCRS